MVNFLDRHMKYDMVIGYQHVYRTLWLCIIIRYWKSVILAWRKTTNIWQALKKLVFPAFVSLLAHNGHLFGKFFWFDTFKKDSSFQISSKYVCFWAMLPSLFSLVMVLSSSPGSKSKVELQFHQHIIFPYRGCDSGRDFIWIKESREILFNTRVSLKVSLFVYRLFYEVVSRWLVLGNTFL